MEFSTVRLVVADMDGTLLNSNHELPSDFYDVHDELRASGILFAAASGRQYFNILKKFPGLENDILFIAENGAYVACEGKELLVQAMDKDLTRQQLTDAKTLDRVYPILCGKKQAYIDDETPEFVEKLALYYDRFKVVGDIRNVEDDEFLKIALCDMRGAEQNSYEYFKDRKDILQIKVSGNIWLDLSDPLANKGNALRHVQELFSITRNQTMAFGDYLNDVEMMREAEFSFAMKNAHPEVKRTAQYLAESNDDNGVLRILYDLVSQTKPSRG